MDGGKKKTSIFTISGWSIILIFLWVVINKFIATLGYGKESFYSLELHYIYAILGQFKSRDKDPGYLGAS